MLRSKNKRKKSVSIDTVQCELFQFKGIKDRQEDSFFVLPSIPGRSGLLAAFGVFDGVSSTLDADEAAFRSATSFQAAILRNSGKMNHLELIKNSILQANQAIISFRNGLAYAGTPVNERPAAVGLVAVLSNDRKFFLAYAGDSTAVLNRTDTLIPITAPHQNADGEVTRFLGQSDLKAEIRYGSLDHTDSLFLLTDGAFTPLMHTPCNPLDFFRTAQNGTFTDNATVIHISLNSQSPELQTIKPIQTTNPVGTHLDIKV